MMREPVDTGNVDVKVTVEVRHDHGVVHVVEQERVYRDGPVLETVGTVTKRACSRAQASLDPERPGA